jgi:hypothetical protein
MNPLVIKLIAGAAIVALASIAKVYANKSQSKIDEDNKPIEKPKADFPDKKKMTKPAPAKTAKTFSPEPEPETEPVIETEPESEEKE